MAGGERDDETGSVKRWLRRADEFLRRRSGEANGKTGGIPQSALTREEASAARRLGAILVEDGVLDHTQLIRVFDRQQELAARGEVRELGEVAIYMGLATPEEIDRATTRRLREDLGP